MPYRAHETRVINVTMSEKLLLSHLPDHCRPSYGPAGVVLDVEDANKLVRALFNMGAMGCSILSVISLAVKVLETFPEAFGEHDEVLDSLRVVVNTLYEGISGERRR